MAADGHPATHSSESAPASFPDLLRLRVPAFLISAAISLLTVASVGMAIAFIGTFAIQVARVEGLSMAPTLEDHDLLLVNRMAYETSEPRRGDIVTLYCPVEPDKKIVKRVIAQEGDAVRMVDGRVYVNDVAMSDDYVEAEFRGDETWGPEIISEGFYFVLGDHRSDSVDSRSWGLVPRRYIIGKVALRWWPLARVARF